MSSELEYTEEESNPGTSIFNQRPSNLLHTEIDHLISRVLEEVQTSKFGPLTQDGGNSSELRALGS